MTASSEWSRWSIGRPLICVSRFKHRCAEECQPCTEHPKLLDLGRNNIGEDFFWEWEEQPNKLLINRHFCPPSAHPKFSLAHSITHSRLSLGFSLPLLPLSLFFIVTSILGFLRPVSGSINPVTILVPCRQSERPFRAYARNIALDPPTSSASMGSVATSDVTLSNAPDSSGLDRVVPKLEPDQDGYDSPSASSMDEDHEAGEPPEKTGADPPPIPKRKGGRKPVGVSRQVSYTDVAHDTYRSMPPRKSGSNGIVRHRQPSANVGPST